MLALDSQGRAGNVESKAVMATDNHGFGAGVRNHVCNVCHCRRA